MTAGIKEVRVIKSTINKKDEDRLRVAAYCRVSSDADDNLNSFFAQVKYYNDYIRKREDMVLVDIYADEGITGTEIQKRDDFKRMLKDAKNGKIDRILVKSVTRFARNSLECIETVRVLKSHGVSVFFENDNIDTECMNSEMILYIKSAFAQGEAMSASKRMQTSVRMRMADGTYVAPSVPFGYRLVNKELEIVPEEAEIVRKIFQLYLSGFGINLISLKLAEQGWAMSEGSVKYILSNERYIGDCLMQKYYTPEILPLREKLNKGELPKYLYTNSHEPLIDREMFDAVALLRKRREENYYKCKSKEKDFFSGKLYCRQCRWVYKRHYDKDGVRYWICSKKGKGLARCKAPRFSDRDIWHGFRKMFNTLKGNSKTVLDTTITQLQMFKDKINGGKSEITEIDRELVSLGEQNNTYNTLFMEGIIDNATYFEQTDQLKRRMYELRSRRKKLVEEDEEEIGLEKLRELRGLVQNHNYVADMDEELFDSIVSKVLIEQNGDMIFCLKCGLELTVNIKKV